MIDQFVAQGYNRLYNIQMGDVWGGYILDQIAPVRDSRGFVDNGDGFSTLDEKKYAGKSAFLTKFYKGGNKPNF